MKSSIKIITAVCTILLCQNAEAQTLTNCRQLMNSGHYYAASVELSKISNENDKEEASALRQICKYWLGEKMGKQEGSKCKNQAIENELLVLSFCQAVKDNDSSTLQDLPAINKNGISQEADDEFDFYAIVNRLYKATESIKGESFITEEAFLEKSKTNPRHEAEAYYYLGYIQMREGKFDQAIQNLSAVQEDKKFGNQALMYLSESYLRLHDSAKAISFSDKINNSASEYIKNEVIRIKGEAYFEQGEYSQAQPLLEQYETLCEERDDNSAKAVRYKLGIINMNSQNWGKAAKLLSSSVPEDLEIAQNARYNAGIAYLKAGMKDNASMAFQQAAETFTGKEQNSGNKKIEEEALYNYAMLLYEGNGMRFGQAVNVFERFLNTFPQSSHKSVVSKHLTEIYFTSKNYTAALASINKIKSPGKEILSAKQKVIYNLGVQYFTEGKYKEAENCMTQVINSEQPTREFTEEAYLWKGESEYQQGNYKAAITNLNLYLSKRSNSENVSLAEYVLGYCHFKQKEYDKALSYFASFTNRESDNSTLKADAFNRMGDCRFTSRQYDEAYSLYENAKEINSSIGDYSIFQQAYIEGLKGNYDKKVELLSALTGTENATNGSSLQSDALYEQGRAYIQTGNKEQAILTFKHLIKLYNQNANARKASNELGMLYYEEGNTEEALKYYKSVLNDHPNTEEAQTALANMKDVYTQMGKVDEYAEMARKAGKSISPEELDEMVLNVALKSAEDKEYESAFNHFSQLLTQTSSEEMRMTALTGKMRNAHLTNKDKECIESATTILNEAKASMEDLSEARLCRAESYLSLNDSKNAVADLKVLTHDSTTVYGAQGTVALAQYAYDTKQYQGAEQILQKFIDSGTQHHYWLARAFILLTDVFCATDRKLEAKEYLLSLESNYSESGEINNMIKERLKALKQNK